MPAPSARSVLRIGGSLSLVLFPLMFMSVFALHMESPAEIVQLKLQHDPYVAQEIMQGLADRPRTQRFYVLPHMLGFLSMPVLVAAALTLGYILFPRKPWFAIVGAAMTIAGAVFMGGMLSMWLGFAAIGRVPAEQFTAATTALAAMIEMQGPLLWATVLTGLSLFGLMVLAIGLFQSELVPRWTAVLIFGGSLMMSIFIDLDNLMFLGASATLVGMAPIAARVFRGRLIQN
ncbi:MAG: hypothetical protein QNJ73_03225 [Gammaproteobacteria bacterium]|nr:hypothetical protein [Gammaproteobacteria bacterium]